MSVVRGAWPRAAGAGGLDPQRHLAPAGAREAQRQRHLPPTLQRLSEPDQHQVQPPREERDGLAGEFDRRESFYSGESIRVSQRGELLG